jgi:hypothetical protein
VKFGWGAVGYMNAEVVKVEQPTFYGGVNRSQILEILFEDYSDVKPFAVTGDGRYQHTNPVLHKIFNKLVTAAGFQVRICILVSSADISYNDSFGLSIEKDHRFYGC